MKWNSVKDSTPQFGTTPAPDGALNAGTLLLWVATPNGGELAKGTAIRWAGGRIQYLPQGYTGYDVTHWAEVTGPNGEDLLP